MEKSNGGGTERSRMMDQLSIMFYEINPHDYPSYMSTEHGSVQPGTIIMESRAIQGIRYTVPIGYLLSVLYFYGYHRPRLSFAERGLSRLHHYFYPSAGYSTPLGILAGIVYACYYDGHLGCSEESAMREEKREHAQALIAWQQHQRMREVEHEAVVKKQVWWGFFYSCWRILTAQRQPQSPPVLSCEDFMELYGIVNVGRQTAEVHDSTFYQRYSKKQVDALVSTAMKLRESPEEKRWLRTAGRFGGFGIVTMVLTWNRGGIFFRSCMGLGLGVAGAAVVSGTHCDS